MAEQDYILEMKGIHKHFPGVKALSNVDFKVIRGHVHALVGENGAGKSTLIKITSGVHPYGSYQGEMIFDGKEVKFNHIRDVDKTGIACIHQELNLVPELSVSENIFLNEKPSRYGFVNFDKMFADTLEILKKIGINTEEGSLINPDEKVINLGVGQKQMIEIAKALSKEARLLILDEPTAALTGTEVEVLLNIIRKLRDEGISSIYISHRLDEVMQIADEVTVLRDGKTIETRRIAEMDKNTMISMMVGRELTNIFPRVPHVRGDVTLEVMDYSVENPDIPGKKLIDNVSFKAYKGEILGISGLMGAGRTELFTAIFGAFREKGSGRILINGKEVKINSPIDALKHGIVLISEDRKKFGLNLIMSIKENVTLAALKKISKCGVLDDEKEFAETQKYISSIRIAAPNAEVQTLTLSGGNQQKVVLSKALFCDPRIIIFDEPTRGIDVGAKYEIYKIMNNLVEQGVVIIMVSSEMQEILGMSDRILTMANGRITLEVDISEATQEILLEASVPGR